MSGHTPGPWLIAEGAFVYALNAEGSNRFSAHIQAGWRTSGRNRTEQGELEANARLITAAPELLEALQGALTILCDSVGDFDYDKALAAIAKATQP